MCIFNNCVVFFSVSYADLENSASVSQGRICSDSCNQRKSTQNLKEVHHRPPPPTPPPLLPPPPLSSQPSPSGFSLTVCGNVTTVQRSRLCEGHEYAKVTSAGQWCSHNLLSNPERISVQLTRPSSFGNHFSPCGFAVKSRPEVLIADRLFLP